MITLESSIVSAHWLHEHLDASNLIVLDASMKKVADLSNDAALSIQIPNSRYFDIKNKFSDVNGKFPNTFPNVKQFESEIRQLGINSDSAVVIYDTNGIYSSPRAWWLFKSFGHDNVAVLDGGLPEWKNCRFKTQNRKEYLGILGNFKANYQEHRIFFFDDISLVIESKKACIFDARSKKRFVGIDPEPRKGLRSGHLPNSKNLPYTELLTNGQLKSIEKLQQIFNLEENNKKQLVFSCGSGITACILALGAEVAGCNNISVYDGSWTEYGSLISSD